MTLVCCCLSFINPILLVDNYERAKEKTRKMAKVMDKDTIQQIKKTKEIKEQWTSFVKVEHGNINKFILILHFMYMYIFYRTGGLLSGCWTNYPALVCKNNNQHHRRLAVCVHSKKWLPWNPEPNCSPGYLNRHHSEELHNPSPENCEDRKAVCSLHVYILHPIVGFILHNEEDNLNSLLFRAEFGTLQYPLPS